MAYFPAFVKMDDKKVLLVGGGGVAYEKLMHLLDFTDKIDIVAKELSSNMQETIQKYKLSFEQRAYKEGDIAGYDMVIVAVDVIALQKAIYEESKNYKILCNAVDATAYCDFIFPSYIKKGDLSIAVSTAGASPAVAKYLRRYLEELVPDSIVNFLEEMKRLRRELPKGEERMRMFDEKAKKYIEKWSR